MRPTNVLILLSDEHHAGVTGHAGHPWVRTPHLDQLAAQGTRFTRAYTPSPICVPARASLATGRYVHQHRCWDNALAYHGQAASWGHRLQDAGVAVEAIGKLHYRDALAATGFDRQQLAAHIMDGIGQVWGSVRDPLPEGMTPAALFREVGAGESAYNRFDRAVADAAVDWLHERQGGQQPWVLFLGFVAPHFPLVVPQPYLDLYPAAALPLPPQHPTRGYQRHPWVERHAQFSQHDEQLGSDARRREALAAYFGLTTFMDEQVGRVLAALDATGLAQDTLVIYGSDHGDNLGARGMWNKCTMYRDATAIPLLLRGPQVPAGHQCATNVSLVDLYPTVLAATGVAPHPDDADLPGRSLLDTAQAPDDPQRLAFSEYHAVGSDSAAYLLADGRYTYHYYVGHRPELFDLEQDPQEWHDLAGDPAQAARLAWFEAQLRARLDPEAVDAAAKRDQQALVASFGGREQALRTGTPGATPVPGRAPA